MEAENTIKVKKSCAVCENFLSKACVLAEERIEILSTVSLLIDAGYAGLKCDSFSLSKHLKIDEDGEENAID